MPNIELRNSKNISYSECTSNDCDTIEQILGQLKIQPRYLIVCSYHVTYAQKDINIDKSDKYRVKYRVKFQTNIECGFTLKCVRD